MADHGGQPDPGLLQGRKAQLVGDEHGNQTLAQVAGEGQQRQLASGQAQHVAGAGIAGAVVTRIAGAEQATEQHGEGQRAQQVGQQEQQPEHGRVPRQEKARFYRQPAARR